MKKPKKVKGTYEVGEQVTAREEKPMDDLKEFRECFF
jgi:hypothetical protein